VPRRWSAEAVYRSSPEWVLTEAITVSGVSRKRVTEALRYDRVTEATWPPQLSGHATEAACLPEFQHIPAPEGTLSVPGVSCDPRSKEHGEAADRFSPRVFFRRSAHPAPVVEEVATSAKAVTPTVLAPHIQRQQHLP